MLALEMVVYGAQLYGRTTRVPGTLHVSTRFLHVMFFPFVPRGSFLVPAGSVRRDLGLEKAYPLSHLHLRSIILAWVRSLLAYGVLGATIVLSTQVLLDKPVSMILTTTVILLATLASYWLSFRADQARPDEVQAVLADAKTPASLEEVVRRRMQLD